MSDTKGKKRLGSKTKEKSDIKTKKRLNTKNKEQSDTENSGTLDSETLEAFAKRLKELRYEHNMTQEALALKLNCATSRIGNYETKRRSPDLKMVQDIADVFDVFVDYLLGRSNVKKFYVDLPSDGCFLESTCSYKAHKEKGVFNSKKETYDEVFQALVDVDILSKDDSPDNPKTKAKILKFIDGTTKMIKTTDEIRKG